MTSSTSQSRRDVLKGAAAVAVAASTGIATSRRAHAQGGQPRARLDGAPKLRPAKRPTTLRPLLTHAAGFSYDIWNANTGRYAKATNMPARATAKVASIRTPLAFDPGDKWEYGVNTDWVGRLVEATSGQTLDAYFRDKIFTPLGMKDSGYVVSAEQRARQARVHVRQADGSLVPH